MSDAIVPLPSAIYPSTVRSADTNTKFKRTNDLFVGSGLTVVNSIPVTLGAIDPVASAGGVKFCTVDPPDLRALAKKCDKSLGTCPGFVIEPNPNKVARCSAAGVPDPSVPGLVHRYKPMSMGSYDNTPRIREGETTYMKESNYYTYYMATTNGVDKDKQMFTGTFIHPYEPTATDLVNGKKLADLSKTKLGKSIVETYEDGRPKNVSFLDPTFHARTDSALIALRRGLVYSGSAADLAVLALLDEYAPAHPEGRMANMCSGNITIDDSNRYNIRATDSAVNTNSSEASKFCYQGALNSLCADQSFFNANPHACKAMLERAKSTDPSINTRARAVFRNLEVGDNYKSRAAEVFGTMIDGSGNYAAAGLFDPSVPCSTKARYDAAPYLCPLFCLSSQANAFKCGLGTQCLTEGQSTPQCVDYCNSSDIAKSNGGKYPCDAVRLQAECSRIGNFDTPLCKGYFARNPTKAYDFKLAHCTGNISDPVCKDYAAATYTNQDTTTGTSVTFSMQEQLDSVAQSFCAKLKADLAAANLVYPIDYNKMTPEMQARCDFCACLISPIGEFGQPTCADTRCQATGWRTAGMKDVTKSCASCMQIINAAGNFINLAGNTQTMTCGGDGGNVVQYGTIPEEQKMAAKYSQQWRERRTTTDGKVYYVSSAKDVAQMLDVFLGDVSMLASGGGGAAAAGNMTPLQMISFMNAFGENHVDSMWSWRPLNSATEVPALLSSMVSNARNRAFVNRLLTHRATGMSSDGLTLNGKGARDGFRLIVLRDDYYDRLNRWANPAPDYLALYNEYLELWRTYNATTNKFVYSIPALGARLDGFITHPSVRMAPGATNENTVEPYLSANIQRLKLFLFALVNTNVTASGMPTNLADTDTLINLLIANAGIAAYSGFAWALINMKATFERENTFRAQLAGADGAVAAYYVLLMTAMRPSRRGYQVYKAIYAPPESMVLVTKYRYLWAVIDPITDVMNYVIGLTAAQAFDKIAADGSIATVSRSVYINMVNLLNFVYKTLGVTFNAATFYAQLTTSITVAKTNMLVMWLTNNSFPIEPAFIDTTNGINTAGVHDKLFAFMNNPLNRDDATATLTPPAPVEQFAFNVYKQYRRVNAANVMYYEAPATLGLMLTRLLGDEVMKPATSFVSDMQFESFMIAYAKIFAWRNAAGALIYTANGAGSLLVAAITDRTEANKAFYRKLLAVFIARSFASISISGNATAMALATNMASLFDARVSTQISCNVSTNRSAWQAVTTLQDLYYVVADVAKADVRYSKMPVAALDNLVYIFRTNTAWLNMSDSRLLLINMLNALVMIYENTGTAFGGIEFTTFVGGLPLDSARKIIQTLLQIKNMADVSTADITPIYTASTKYGDIVTYITDPLVIDSLQRIIKATYAYDAFSLTFQNRYRMSNTNAFYYAPAGKTPIQLFDEMLGMAEMNVGAAGDAVLGTDQYYSMLIAFYDLFTWRSSAGPLCFTPSNGDPAQDLLFPALSGQVDGRAKFYGKLVGTFSDDGGIFKDTRIATLIANIKKYMLRGTNLTMVRSYLLTAPWMEYNNALCRSFAVVNRTDMTVSLSTIPNVEIFAASKTIAAKFDSTGNFETAYLSIINLFELGYVVNGVLMAPIDMLLSSKLLEAWSVKLPEYEYERVKTMLDPRIGASRQTFDTLRMYWYRLSMDAYKATVTQKYSGLNSLIINLIKSNLYMQMTPGNYSVRVNYSGMPPARDIIDSLLPVNSVPDDRCAEKLTLAMASFYTLAIDAEKDSSSKFSNANDEAISLIFDSRRAGFANCILGAGMASTAGFPDAVKARLDTFRIMVQAKIIQLLPPPPPPISDTPTPTPTPSAPISVVTQSPDIITDTLTALVESVAAQDQIGHSPPAQPPADTAPPAQPQSHTQLPPQQPASNETASKEDEESSSNTMLYVIIMLIVVIIVVVMSGGKKTTALTGGVSPSPLQLLMLKNEIAP